MPEYFCPSCDTVYPAEGEESYRHLCEVCGTTLFLRKGEKPDE